MSAGSMVASFPRAVATGLSEPAVSLSAVGKVLASLEKTARRCGRPVPRLVAVTKKQGVEKVRWGYQQGLRHFGENYACELRSKATYLKSFGAQYSAIKWHYIGNLQRNKVKLLVDCPGLWMVETVAKQRTADMLNKAWACRTLTAASAPLKVLLQVNTSKEENKLGCVPEEVQDLMQFLLEDCPHLELCGLMTIGRQNHLPLQGPNPDFADLVKCRDLAVKSPKFPRSLELSMGMSSDYQHAIEMGSTSVRVGTALFGPREE